MFWKNKISRFSKTLFLVVSCFGLIFIACDFSIPKSVEIQVSDSHYELPLGNLQTSKYFTADKFLDEMQKGITDEKITIYDYNEGGNSQDMVFLMEYNLFDIPLDFTEQLKQIDFEKILAEGLDKEISVEKPEDMSFEFDNSLDLNGKILDSLCETKLADLPIFETGSSLGDKNGVPTIDLEFTSPKFDYAEFNRGDLTLSFEKKSGEPTAGFSFKAKVGLYDNAENLISDSGNTLIDCTNGGVVSIPLAGKSIGPKLRIKIYGEFSGGTPLNKITYKTSFGFNNAKLKKIVGICMDSDELGDIGAITLDDIKIPLESSLGSTLDHAKINEGFLKMSAKAPDGWKGFNCEIENLNISGGFNLSESDFVPGDVEEGVTYFVNKKCVFDGKDKELRPVDAEVGGTLKLSFNKATLCFPDDGSDIPLKIVGTCDIKSLGETTVNLDGILGDRTFNNDFKEPLPSDALNFLKSISFSKLKLEGGFEESTLPDCDLKIEAKMTSTAFGLSDEDPMTLEMTTSENFKEEKEIKPAAEITLDKEKPESDANKIDAVMEMTLSGPNAEKPELVTFNNFELGKKYSLKMNFSFDFDIEELVLYTDDKNKLEDSIETKLNVNELFKSTLGDVLTEEQLSHIGFHSYDEEKDDGTFVYLYVSKPETGENVEVEDPLEILSAKASITCSDGKLGEGETGTVLTYPSGPNEGKDIYIIGTEDGPSPLNFSKSIDLKNFVDEKLSSSDGKKQTITKKRDLLFPEGSYSKKLTNFADVLNAKPKDLYMNYSMSLGDDANEGEITITGDQFNAMKNIESDIPTSIQIKMIVYLPIALDVTTDKNRDGFEIPDMLGLYEKNATSEDLMKRKSASDMDDIMKYIDLIDSMGVTYKSNYDMNTKMVFKCVDENEKAVISKTFSIDTTSQQKFVFDTTDIKKAFETCPLYPKISISVGNDEDPGTITTFKIPRELELSLSADIKLKEGARISLWEQ